MVEVQHITEDHRQRQLTHGMELKRQLNEGRTRAFQAHEAFIAEVLDRARQLGTAHEQRDVTGQGTAIRQSRSADLQRKAQVVQSMREAWTQNRQDIGDTEHHLRSQLSHDADLNRASRIHGIKSARGHNFDRLRHVASETQAEVNRWHHERKDFERGYLAQASSNRHATEAARARMRKAREDELNRRSADARAARDKKLMEAAEMRKRLDAEAQRCRMLHDKIQRGKMADHSVMVSLS